MEKEYYHPCNSEKELRDFLRFLDQQNQGYVWYSYQKAYVKDIIEVIIKKPPNNIIIFINQDKKYLLYGHGEAGLNYAKMHKIKPYPYQPNFYDF